MDIIETKIGEKLFNSKLFDMYFNSRSMAILDIETTGLSPQTSQVVLIGLLISSGDKLTFRQYFAETLSDEAAVLEATLNDIKNIDTIVTYNGQSFDVPFISKRLKSNGLEATYLPYNLDLYRVVKGYSNIGQFTPNLKQKTLEDFMGLWTDRKDEISGKESVDLYYSYLTHGLPHLKDKILLHNKDDVLQLSRLLKVIEKVDLDKAMFSLGFPLYNNHQVQKLRLLKNKLLVHGTRDSNHPEYISYGDYSPSYVFEGSKFEANIPILRKEGLSFVDLQELNIPPSLFPNQEKLSSDYLVLSENDKVSYQNASILSKFLIERMIRNEF